MILTRKLLLTACMAGLTSFGMTACGDDDDVDRPADPDAGPGPNPAAEQTFRLRIENISDQSALPTPISPGVWATHGADVQLFTVGEPAANGLEAIAEDGNPAPMADYLATAVPSSGAFNTPEGASMPGPLMPGQAYELEFTAEAAQRLSLATMFVQSNDVFLAPAPAGIELFDDAGEPLAERDITDLIALWDAGTEQDEAPGDGAQQAPRGGPESGPAEGVVAPFSSTTRGLPLAGLIADVAVEEADGTFTITVSNISGDRGTLLTPLAPVFFATHGDSWSLFTEGEADAGAGLENLAEDGSPAALVASHSGAAGVGTAGAQARTAANPGADGPALPGDSYTFMVTPSAEYPRLSIATMVVETNDAFLAFPPSGVLLIDEAGNARPAADVAADMKRLLAVWDAGTEANEVPGVGPNQAGVGGNGTPRQGAPNTGPVDPNTEVRRYMDATNDLAGENAGGFLTVTIDYGAAADSFDVTIRNTSGGSAYPGVLSPPLYAVHDGSVMLFEGGAAASEGLEALAEDGNAAVLADELRGNTAVGMAGVAGAGPLMPGAEVTFTVTADAANRYLNVASMIVPSNDAFVALGATGIELLDAAGARRSEADIAADVAAALGAWDAGTETNEAGAAGANQAPRGMPNTGAPEGDGSVRELDDPVWIYPPVNDVVRVTITPVQ